MANKVRFAFTEVDPSLGALSTLPYLPLTLTYQSQSLNVSGLLDTGSSVADNPRLSVRISLEQLVGCWQNMIGDFKGSCFNIDRYDFACITRFYLLPNASFIEFLPTPS